MKKTLDTAGIANELKGASLFFAPVASEKLPQQRRKLNSDQAPHPKTAEGFSGKEKGAPAQTQQTRPQERTTGATNEGTNETTKQRFTERTVKRPFERTKIRHTFDVFADQVTSLKHIQLEREETFAKRYLLGELVQEALDLFITRERNNE